MVSCTKVLLASNACLAGLQSKKLFHSKTSVAEKDTLVSYSVLLTCKKMKTTTRQVFTIMHFTDAADNFQV